MKIIKIVVIVASLMMAATIFSANSANAEPNVQTLQYLFISSPAALFNALLAGQIDLMGWPLSWDQYLNATYFPNVQLAPYYTLDAYEIAFNNNATDPSHTADRKAMNYTEFRQAMACLVDKDGLTGGGVVGSFGTRIDTQVARPMLDAWVNFDVCKYDSHGDLINNYPWDYNETHALEILWTNGWYSHATYGTLDQLLNEYYSHTPLPSLPMGSVVYPPSHPRAGVAVDSIVAYVRTDNGVMSSAGFGLSGEMRRLGIATTEVTGGSSVCYNPVFINHDYDFYTGGWTFGTHPLHFYSMNTPAGIYPGGQNIYMIDDGDMTYHATMEYPKATTVAQSMDNAKECQRLQVMEAMLVPLFTPKAYMGYKTGALGVISFRGYGLIEHLDYTWLNIRSGHPPPQYQEVKYGLPHLPVQINPIFSTTSAQYEVVDGFFCGSMALNPYRAAIPGKSPAGADQPWMAYDWKYQLSTFNGGGGLGNPDQTYTDCANVTFWFRHDITWQDEVPWTVEDFNYTIYIHKTYADSYGYSDMNHTVNLVKWDDWTCSVYFDMPSIWTLYMTNYDQIPEHIYKYIAIPADAPLGTSTTGLHGYWPGKDATSDQILPGAPFTFSQLVGVGGERYVWIGTNMWKYIPGTLAQEDGGGLVCTTHSGFWMTVAQGEIDFGYEWNPGSAPQGGSYRIGLSDLVLLANAYGTTGTGAVPFKVGGLNAWEPGCDLALPSCTVGLSDLVTLAINYGGRWGFNP